MSEPTGDVISTERIDEAIELLVEYLRPEQIYICGSYSVGTATEDSDLDILVVKDGQTGSGRRVREAEHLLLGLMLPIDLYVVTPPELQEEKGVEYSFLRSITERQGWLAYDRTRGGFLELNRRWGAVPSEQTHEKLLADPGEWQLYQSLYRRARRRFAEQPYEIIAQELRTHPTWKVADFGCGEALLAKAIPNDVISIDHAAADPSVLVCDMASTPLADKSVDAVVFCLSLVGKNWQDYLREGRRVVRSRGRIYVAELRSRWARGLGPLLEAISRAGLQIQGKPRDQNGFVYVTGVAP